MRQSAAQTKEVRSPAITVRWAVPADAGAIHDMIVKLARARHALDRVVSSAEDIARDGFGSNPAFEALIGELNGEPVGLCLFFASYSTWRGQRGLYLQDLVVAARARGLGVGAHLLAEAAAIGRARGCGYLRLSVEADNQRAQAFYARQGLRHAEAEQIYLLEEDGLDALAERVEETGA